MIGKLLRSIRADYASVQAHREKYHHERIAASRLPIDAVKKIGFQMMIATRVMRFFRDARVPLMPMVTSRMIRHLYGAEIHWNAELADGISIVHGNGLVLSHRARVSEGCILFHNVTLGESIDPVTKQSGAPLLEKNVHVGPGATLLGPITVGEGTKIGAGAVLSRSVPPFSLVMPADPVIKSRK